MVIPGMELCTQEEAHVVCLFPDIPAAEAFEDFVRSRSMEIPNRPEIFGRQLVMDEQDHILDEEKRLLIHATQVGVDCSCATQTPTIWSICGTPAQRWNCRKHLYRRSFDSWMNKISKNTYPYEKLLNMIVSSIF